MKKRIALLLVLAMVMSLFTGCCLKHDWEDATCDDPMTCSKCGEIKGDPLDHEWVEATCAKPKHCELCGKTRGEALAHTWEAATCAHPTRCTACGATEGEALEHTVDSWTFNGNFMNGNCSVCGQSVSQEIDWEVYANELILGDWDMTALFIGDNQTSNSGYAEFNADGTAVMALNGKRYSATWTFDFRDDGAEDGDPCLFYTIYQAGDEYVGIIFDDDPNGLALVLNSDDMVILYDR